MWKVNSRKYIVSIPECQPFIVHTILPFYKAGTLLPAFMLMKGPDTRLGKGLTYNKKVTDLGEKEYRLWSFRNISYIWHMPNQSFPKHLHLPLVHPPTPWLMYFASKQTLSLQNFSVTFFPWSKTWLKMVPWTMWTALPPVDERSQQSKPN